MTNVVQLPNRQRGDAFTVKKLEWIEAVTLDTSIPAEAARLGTLLAIKFMSRRSGCAFPSQQTLAGLMGISERQVRRLMAVLVEAGHIEQNRRGRNRSNEYRISKGTGRQRSAQDERDRTSEGGGTGHPTSAPGPDATRPPNPMREPNEEPIERRPSAAEPSEGHSTLDVSRGSRLDGAPSSQAEKEEPVTFRVGEWRRNSKGERYEVTAVDEAARTVTGRFAEDGRVVTQKVPSGAVLVPAGGDDMDDEIPF